MWSINQLEKATQVGARMAVVTDMVPGGLAAANYAETLGQGAAIPPESFGAAKCVKPAAAVTCTCKTDPCPALTPVNTSAFDSVVNRMQLIDPLIAPSSVEITYTNSGLGYAGDPNPGGQVAPIVTVKAFDVAFTPIIFQFFNVTMNLPPESVSLTLEDGAGTTSN
jgi:hypothetical protein